MPKKYKHITLVDRTLIQTQLQQGFKPAAIAAGLRRPRSCVHANLPAMAGKHRLSPDPLGVQPLRVVTLPVEPTGGREAFLSCRVSVVALVVGNPLWNKVSDGLRQGLLPEQVEGHTEAHERAHPPVPRNDLPSDLRDAQGWAAH